MKLLQMGVPKSGNYWLYNILRKIYEMEGIPLKSFIRNQPVYKEARHWDLSNHLQAGIDMMDIERGKCFYRISSVVREPVEDLDEYVNSSNHIWTHSEVCENIEPVLGKFSKLVYIYRDPRDVAVSASRYAFTPYMMKYYPHKFASFEHYLEENLPGIIHYWMWHVTDYLLLKDRFDIHFIAFENLLEDFDNSAHSLTTYLDLDFPPEKIRELEDEVSFQTMRKKDPGHVKKGKRMQWTGILSEKQKSFVSEMAGSLLDLLNYPADEKRVMPVDANNLNVKDVREIAERLKSVTIYVPS